MEPQWRRFRYEYRGQVQWRYCMGGLLPGWNQFSDAVQGVSRPAQMGPLWMEAAHLSGMPIDNTIWALDPPASSYPACIAVKCAQEQSAEAGELYLRQLREAVMLRGENMASFDRLLRLAASLAAQHPALLNLERFLQNLEANKGKDAFRTDLEEVRSKAIRRFPSLVFRRKGAAPLILQGYRPYAVWLELMQTLAPELVRKPAASADDYEAFWGSLQEREKREIGLP